MDAFNGLLSSCDLTSIMLYLKQEHVINTELQFTMHGLLNSSLSNENETTTVGCRLSVTTHDIRTIFGISAH